MEANIYTDDLNYNRYLLLIAADQIHDFWHQERAFKAFKRNGYIVGGSKQTGGGPPEEILLEYNYFIDKLMTEPFHAFPLDDFAEWGNNNGADINKFREQYTEMHTAMNFMSSTSYQNFGNNSIKESGLQQAIFEKLPEDLPESIMEIIKEKLTNEEKIEGLIEMLYQHSIIIEELEQTIQLYNSLVGNRDMIISYMDQVINNVYEDINMWFDPIFTMERLIKNPDLQINMDSIDESNVDLSIDLITDNIVNTEINSLPNIILNSYIKLYGISLLDYIEIGPNGDGDSFINLLDEENVEIDNFTVGITYYISDIIEKFVEINKVLVSSGDYDEVNEGETISSILAILLNILFAYYPLDGEEYMEENKYLYCIGVNIFVDIFSKYPLPWFIKTFILQDNNDFIQLLLKQERLEYLVNSGFIENPQMLSSMILTINGIIDIEDYGEGPEYEGSFDQGIVATSDNPESFMDIGDMSDNSDLGDMGSFIGGTKRTSSSVYINSIKTSAQQLYSSFTGHPIIKKMKKRKNLNSVKAKTKLWLSYLKLLKSIITYFLTKFALPKNSAIRNDPLIQKITKYIEKFKLDTTVNVGTGTFEADIFNSIKDEINTATSNTIKKYQNTTAPTTVTIDQTIIDNTKILNNATSLDVVGAMIPNLITLHDKGHTDPSRITDGQDKTECLVSSIVDPQKAFGFHGNTCDFSQGSIRNPFGNDIATNYAKQLEIMNKSIDNGITMGINTMNSTGTSQNVLNIKNTMTYSPTGYKFNVNFNIKSVDGSEFLSMSKDSVVPFKAGYSGDRVISMLYNDLKSKNKVQSTGLRTKSLLEPNEMISILLLKTFGDTSQELVGTMWNQLIAINNKIAVSNSMNPDPEIVTLATARGISPPVLIQNAGIQTIRLQNSIPAFFANDYLSVARNIFTNQFFKYKDSSGTLIDCNTLRMYSGFCSSSHPTRPKPTICPNNPANYYCSNDTNPNQCNVPKYTNKSLCPKPPPSSLGTLYLYKSVPLTGYITGGKMINKRNSKKTIKKVKSKSLKKTKKKKKKKKKKTKKK